ncbi:MAG: glycosyltransferase family 2 protein [Methanobacteriaceae archaeon]|nr:glycosyltransferase family 2 protein [Methanobacteriaceae archaeon]
MMPNVSIIILNWNGWEDTVECLESLYRIDYPNYNVIIVDNGSSDDSLFKIKEYLNEVSSLKYNNQDHIKIFEYTKEESESIMECIEDELAYKNFFIIKNSENRGFAEGNNTGIRFVLNNLKDDYIALLNNDTIVDSQFLKELINIAEIDMQIGSVQSVLLNRDGTLIDSLGQKIFIWGVEDIGMGSNNRNNFEYKEIFGSCAASALYRRRVFEKISLFDPDFFIILEDVDLSWKIRLNDLKAVLAPKSIVHHKRGISNPMTITQIFFKPKTNDILFKWYHGSKNWMIIVLRYFPVKYVIAAIILKPHKFFFTFYRFLYSSIKLKTFFKGTEIILNNFKIRKEIKKNILLEKIQKNCIKFN